MALQPHLVYYADKRLRMPFDRAYEKITNFMRLASEATRPPIDALVTRHLVRDNRVVEQIELREAGVGGSPGDVRLVIDEGLRRFKETDIVALVTWCPNLLWEGRDTFSRIDLEEKDYHLGQERTHFIRIVSSNVPERHLWAFIYLSTPFEKPGPDFEEFVREAERHLPFRLTPAKWRLAVPTKDGKRFKVQRLKDGTP